ncbi:MAG: glycosyltransferase family 4 protein [Bacteroidetes bacterium]|nr:glycosyltransferase family 4 protein [Bacteroidota bacterium]
MKNIALLSYNHNKYSETFIQDLVKHLPYKVHYLYGGELPMYNGSGNSFMDTSPKGKLKKAYKEWLGTPEPQQHKKAVEQYLLKHNIEAVYANYAITAFPVMEICNRLNIPLIVHFWGWTAYRSTLLEKYKKEYAELFQIAKAVICVSTDMQKQLISLGCPASKVHYVSSWANTELFTYSDHSSNPPIFFTAGRFCDTKNPHLTVLAFSKALPDIPNAKLVMAGGDENLMNACVNLCKALGIADKVAMLGAVPQQQIFALTQQAYAFVQHSATTILNEKEGTPYAILEACAAGLPVIATRHAGVCDVVIENETGLLCNEYDVDAMAADMVKLWNDKEMAKRIGMAASKHVREHYNMEQQLTAITAIVDNVRLK